MRNIVYILLFLVAIASMSCSGTKGISADENLYTGTTIKYLDKHNLEDRRNVNSDLLLSLPKKNTPGLFNIKTWFYNIYDSTGTSGVKHTVKYKLGSEPVVYKDNMLAKVESRVSKIMGDYGYFRHEVSCDTLPKKRKVGIECEVKLGKRFTIDSVFVLQDEQEISKVLDPLYNVKYLRQGDRYKTYNINRERQNLITTSNDNGFPLVTATDAVFYVDTLQGDANANIHILLAPTEDSLKYQRYFYGNMYINPNFILEKDNPYDTTEMVRMDRYFMKDGYDFLREDALNDAIFFKQNAVYDARRSKITLDRLLDFGLFKFVNVNAQLRDGNKLDQFYNLTAKKMQSIIGEIELNNRSGNYLGFLGKSTYSHRNLFGGAEQFDLSLTGGVETQFEDQQSLINTSNIGLEATMTLPTVKLPFFSFQTNKNFIPKTYFALSAALENRTEFYSVSSAKARYGFKWNETNTKSHSFTPIDLNWLVTRRTTEKFDAILADDIRLARSFENTLILGSTYDFYYNKRGQRNPNNQISFRGTVEAAGNLLSLFFKPGDTDPQAKLFGTQYSQYVRLTADARRYLPMGDATLAMRFIAGGAFAYGNSTEIPYAKQYSIGGSNSVRAYRLRRLGPGSFLPVDPTNTENQFIDQTGDIKLEANLEYRFPILGFIKGAAFVDAGNVWLYDSEERPEGVFDPSTFYKEIAVGAGVGFRFDFNFFVFRFDLAFPLRDIDADDGFEWVVKDINIFDGDWIDEQLVFNLGIGYPF